MDQKQNLTKIAKLIAALYELHDKEALILTEIEALAAGEDGIGLKMKRLTAAFVEGWARLHAPAWIPGEGKAPYAWLAKDSAGLKRLLAALSEPAIAARMASYFATEDPWVIRNTHPFSAFERMINQLAGAVRIEDPGDDEAATRRRLREMRG